MFVFYCNYVNPACIAAIPNKRFSISRQQLLSTGVILWDLYWSRLVTDKQIDGHNDSIYHASIALSSKKHKLHLFWSPAVCCTHSFAVFICPYSLLHYTKLSIAYRLLYWDGILSNQMPVGWLVGATTQLLRRRYMMAYSRVVLTPYLFDNFTRSHSGLVVSTSNCGLRGSRFKFHCEWLCYGYAALGMASTKVNSALHASGTEY